MTSGPGAAGRPVVISEAIDPPGLARPSGFSHAVRSSGGLLVHLAGQTALDPAGRIVGTTIVEQFRQALGNLLTALEAAGGRPNHLVSMTIYLVDVDLYQAHGREVGAVWRDLVGNHWPATAAVGVSRLWDRAAMVELQGVAVVPDVERPVPGGGRAHRPSPS